MKTKKVSKVHSGGTIPIEKPENAVRARIIASARELFFHSGFVRVTADEIAAELGISKATLYKEFRSKEEILLAVVREFMAEVAGLVDILIKNEGLSFVDRLAALSSLVGSRISELGPLFIRDIQKSAPAVWKEIQEFRRDKIIRNFKKILVAGHDRGLFRGDIDADLLMQMFLKLVEEFITPAEVLRSGRSPAETFASVVKVFFQGILTDRGRLDFSARTPALFEPRKGGAL